MRKVLKVIGTIILVCFLIYVFYRNINLRTIPSVDLIKDESTSSLYHSILPNTSNSSWTNYYYNNASLTVNDIPEELKYNIAYKNTGTAESVIKEEVIKKAYEKVFGTNTYKAVESFIGGCNTYKYDEKSLSYVKITNDICKTPNIYILSKIVDADLTDTKMDITVVIAYIDKAKKIVYQNCNDDMTTCNNTLVKSFIDFDEASLDEEKYNLQKYKFTFTTTNNKYYFSSVKKIK